MKFLSRKLSHPVRHEQKIVNFLTGSDFYVQFLFYFFPTKPYATGASGLCLCVCVYVRVVRKKLDVDRRICACISWLQSLVDGAVVTAAKAFTKWENFSTGLTALKRMVLCCRDKISLSYNLTKRH